MDVLPLRTKVVGYDVRCHLGHGLFRGLAQVQQLDVGLVGESGGEVCGSGWGGGGAAHAVKVLLSSSMRVAVVLSFRRRSTKALVVIKSRR